MRGIKATCATVHCQSTFHIVWDTPSLLSWSCLRSPCWDARSIVGARRPHSRRVTCSGGPHQATKTRATTLAKIILMDCRWRSPPSIEVLMVPRSKCLLSLRSQLLAPPTRMCLPIATSPRVARRPSPGVQVDAGRPLFNIRASPYGLPAYPGFCRGFFSSRGAEKMAASAAPIVCRHRASAAESLQEMVPLVGEPSLPGQA